VKIDDVTDVDVSVDVDLDDHTCRDTEMGMWILVVLYTFLDVNFCTFVIIWREFIHTLILVCEGQLIRKTVVVKSAPKL
jgi:hypothetical protein